MQFRDADATFQRAIDAKYLSDNPKDPHYAGNYMYMNHDDDGNAYFKHCDTRKYLRFNDDGMAKFLAAYANA